MSKADATVEAEILRAFLWAFKANLWPVGYLEPWVLRTSFSLFYITLCNLYNVTHMNWLFARL